MCRSPLFFLVPVLAISVVTAAPDPKRPNVLFIALDDQNDWIGALGGHPLVRTPNIARLARRGTVFLNAHCQAPLCNPSRTSVMLGVRPTTSGVYGLAPWFRSVPAVRERVTLPQHFRANGYATFVTGKIYHDEWGPESLRSEFEVLGPAGGARELGVKPARKLIPPTPMGNHPLMDWGAFPHRDDERGDYPVATWAAERLRTMPTDRPFFLAAGIFLPHVPCYAPPVWFAPYPDDDSVLPPYLAGDRDDTPRFSWALHWELPEPRLKWLRENRQWRNLVRSYLASVSYADAQIGRILDALEASGHADNTIVVLWGDNGWHLGEKDITGKNTLWERSTRVPLIFAGPGVVPGGRCTQPAELLDIYPTLAELCRLSARPDLEGLSLGAQLRTAGTRRERPALTTHNPGNHAVRSERYRYIRYADGSEELYDLQSDPNEWENLAGRREQATVVAEHRKWLPKTEAEFAPGSALRILSYDPASGDFVWEGKRFRKDSPIPE